MFYQVGLAVTSRRHGLHQCVWHWRRMLGQLDMQHHQGTRYTGYEAMWVCAQGWRFVFLIMSALALTVTVLVLVFGIEPRSLKAKRQGGAPKQAGRGGAAAVWANLRAMVNPRSMNTRKCAGGL